MSAATFADVDSTVAAEVGAVELTGTEIDVEAAINDLAAKSVDEVEIKVVQTRAARALMAGHSVELKKNVTDTLTRLGIKGDPTKYRVMVSAESSVNATIQTAADGVTEVHISAGLLGTASNADEFAWVLGHELTHKNPELFKLPKDPARVKEILGRLSSTMSKGHVEELRADLGSVHRLIEGGYNPWAGYDVMKKIAEIQAQSKDLNSSNASKRLSTIASFVGSHPDSELRMSVMKSYITLRQQSENLSAVIGKKNPYSAGMKALSMRLTAYTALGNPYFRQKFIYRPALTAGATAATVALTSMFFSPDTAAPAAHVLSDAVSSGAVSSSAAVEHTRSFVQAAGSLLPDFVDAISKMSAERGAKILALVLGSGGAGGWGVSKFRSSREDKLIAEAEQMIRDRNPQLRLAETRVPKVILLQRELAGKGTFDRTQTLEKALKANVEAINLLEGDNITYWAARKTGLSREVIETRVLQPLREEAKNRQLLLHEVVAEFMPKISKEKLSRLSGEISKLTSGNLVTPWVRGSVQDLATQSRALHPEFRFSSTVERLLLEQQRADATIARVAMESTTESFDSILRQSQALMDGMRKVTEHPVDPKNPKLIQGPKKVQKSGTNNVRQLFELNEPYVDQWVEAMRTPGEQGERAAKLFTSMQRLFADAYGSPLTESERSRFTEKAIESLAQQKGEPANLRILNVQNSLVMAVPDKDSEKKRIARDAIKKKLDATPELWESLEKFKTVEDLERYIQSEYFQKQGLKPTDWPMKDLWRWIQARPGLVQSQRDIDLLLDRSYFWNTMGTGAANLDYKLMQAIQSKLKSKGTLWEYRPSTSEVFQKRILDQMAKFGTLPKDRGESLALWQKMVGRGVTNTTDQLFGKLYDDATPAEKVKLGQLTDGRLWEPQLRARVLGDRLKRTDAMKTLSSTADVLRPDRATQIERVKALREVARLTENEFSGRGPEYDDVLEKISAEVKTSEFEVRYLDRYRGPPGAGQVDVTARTLSALGESIKSLDSEEKWNMILWLRGEKAATKSIEDLFPVVGSDRVQRMYSLMPEYQKAVFIDNILDSKNGLMPHGGVQLGWGKQIVDYLVGTGGKGSAESEKARTVAREILEAYLDSFKGASGHAAQRTLVLSYMLASKAGDGSNGKVLKQVLEAMGASGVKIGQFIVAADILPESDNAILRTLQDQANRPKRSRMYSDITRAMRGQPLPGKIDDLLGSASVKYAAKALDLDDGHPFVLKVLRDEASATVDSQFDRLNVMADTLKSKYGTKYSVLRSIIRASREAIHRELKLENEVRNTKDATREIYEGLKDFNPPREQLVDPTMISAEFAEGSSIHDLLPDSRGAAAKRIMEVEGDNLFADKDEIYFDPDRHPGNFKIQVDPISGELKFRPIDFGQLLKITRGQRAQVIDLFAISGIMDKYGASDWSSKMILKSLGLSEKDSSKLRKLLAKSFPAADRSPLASYYSILSALEDVGHPQPIEFFDFARAVVQHNQYVGIIKEATPGLLDAKFKTPRDRLTEQAVQRAEQFGKDMKLSMPDKIRFAWATREELPGKMKSVVGNALQKLNCAAGFRLLK